MSKNEKSKEGKKGGNERGRRVKWEKRKKVEKE